MDALYWYLAANHEGSRAEGGLIIGQAALELLAWTLLVIERKMITRSKFKSRPRTAGDNISALLGACHIPTSIPVKLAELHTALSQTKWTDGPSLINGVRNDLVHPEKDGHEQLAYEAWQLALHYVELVIFYLCKYDGRYSNRTSW